MAIQHRDNGSIVTLSKDDHPALASTLQRELGKARTDQVEGLLFAKDWPDYEKRRGTINGIDAAISICEQVRKKLES